MVSRITHNPLLKGWRFRGKRVSKRHNKTGRHRTVKANPDQVRWRECPHLAFIDPERYDRVIALLDDRNSRYGRKDHLKPACQWRTKQGMWPSGVAHCGICGRHLVYQGLAGSGLMMCSGACEYRCWNSVTLNSDIIRKEMPKAIFGAIQKMPNFDPGYRLMVEQKAAAAFDSIDSKQKEIERKLKDIENQLNNLVRFVAGGADQASAIIFQRELQGEKAALETDLLKLDKAKGQPIALPSDEELRQMAGQAFEQLDWKDPAVARKLKRLIPRIDVYPMRRCNGGKIVLRAKFVLNLVPLFNGLEYVEDAAQVLQIPMEVDVFDPPQCVAYRKEIVRLKQCRDDQGKKLGEREIAERLSITQPAVQNAMALHRQMKTLGLADDPYLPVHEPPAGCHKLRRYRHARYRFDPLPGNGDAA